MKQLTYKAVTRLLGPEDKAELGSHYFDALTSDLRIDPCVATVRFGDDVLTLHITANRTFKVGSVQAPMHLHQLAACRRAHMLIRKLNLRNATTP